MHPSVFLLYFPSKNVMHAETRPLTPACGSPQVISKKIFARDFPRTFATTSKAFYWQSPDDLQVWPYRFADKWIFENGLDENPPVSPESGRAFTIRWTTPPG
jgi:hypothetical protein